MEIKREPDLEEKLKILSDAAKYDVACTSAVWNQNEKNEVLAIPEPGASATALQLTADVFLC